MASTSIISRIRTSATQSKIPAIVVIAITILFVLPIIYLSKATTLNEILTIAQAHYTMVATINSVSYAGCAAALGVIMGAFYSWLVDRTDMPGRSILRILVLLPLAIPEFIKAIAWTYLLSPKIGLINVAYMNAFHTNQPLFNIFSLGGMILIGSFGIVPLSYLIISAALRGIDPSLEESSRTMGRGAIGTFIRVDLPLLRPALAAAFLLNFIGALSLFDIAFIIGIPAHVTTLILYVYSAVESEIPNYPFGAGISFLYLGITIALALVYMYTTKGGFRFRTVGGKGGRSMVIHLGKWKYVALAACLVLLTLAFFLEAVIILLVSLTSSYNGTFSAFRKLTLVNYHHIFADKSFILALQTSLVISFIAALITTFLAAIFAYAIIRSPGFRAKVFDFLGFLPTSFPGVVYDLGLLWAFVSVPLVSRLYGTIWPIILALVAIWMARPIRIITSRMIQISPDLEQAGSVAGAKWTRIFGRIVLPLLSISLVNSFVYVFMDSFRELGAVTLLSTGQTYTLTIYISDLYTNGLGAQGEVSALSCVMMVILLSVLAVLLTVTNRQGAWHSESL